MSAPLSGRAAWISWQVVAIAFIGCATVFALVFWGGQKLGEISTFLGAVATIVVAIYLRQVKQDTNGNLSKRDAQIAELQRQLTDLHMTRASEAAQMAKQVPSTASLPSTLVTDSHALGGDGHATVPMSADRRV